MRISDWSSDVCSSDLRHDLRQAELPETEIDGGAGRLDGVAVPPGGPRQPPGDLDAGSARDRIGRLVETDEADERPADPDLDGEDSPAAPGHPPRSEDHTADIPSPLSNPDATSYLKE